jgi:hypothetical protein
MERKSKLKRHLPFTGRQLILCGVLFAAIILHVASLCVDIKYYGSALSSEFGKGCYALFWGGDAEQRNLAVCNAGEWPLRPETHFAGEEVAGNGQKWEAYVPSLKFDRQWFAESIRYNGLFPTFGYSLPQLRREDEAASFLVPLGTVALIVEVTVLFMLFRIYSFPYNK